MQSNVAILQDAQDSFEQRFNCLICLCPKLRNVYGSCQHRLCEDCLYDSDGVLRENLNRCPVCQKQAAFPKHRPDIPEDSVEMMRCLGVRVCTNPGCSVELWDWEVDTHKRQCSKGRNRTPLQNHNRKHSLDSDHGQELSYSRRTRNRKDSCPIIRRRSARIRNTPENRNR